jgi:geranylgeranyl reductase family protein
MQRQEWDVVIVGAGPAGCAAAAAAIRHVPPERVLLVDRQLFPRDKACGDGIAFEALAALADLGFDMGALLDGCPPIGRLRLQSPGGAVADRQMRHPVRVIPRTVFDARLVSDVLARGVALAHRAIRDVQTRSDGVLLDRDLRAGVVIGADGAESVVRRAIGAPEPGAGRVALAIRGYAPELPGQRGAQWITMTRRHWPAYAWSFPLGDGRANVGYGELLTGRPLTRADMLDRMRKLLPGLDPAVRGLRAHRLPLTPGRPAIRAGRVLLAGDAMSLINPLSGEGIYYAVRSGALAGFAASRDGAAGSSYRRLIARALGRHFRATDAAARLVRAPRLIDAGVRAAAHGQASFDDLVRLGLGDGVLTVRLLLALGRRIPG